ncbi:MAG: NusG domain II-containing protein [Clostridiaceae bacterium]
MKKGDKIAALVIAFMLVISSVSVFLYMNLVKGSHHIAEIKQDGKVIKTIDLDKVLESQEVKIAYDNVHFNVVRIEKGRIRITDADCPDKVCVKTGWVTQSGQSIICLPHKLIIKIEGGSKDIDSNVY